MGSFDKESQVASPFQQLRLLAWQVSGLAVPCGLMWQFGKQELALAALIGGGIAILPFHYFLARAFRFQGAENVVLFKRSLAQGQVGRYLLTAALFAITLRIFTEINPWPLFGGFAWVLLIQIIGSALILTQSKSDKRLQ